MRLLLLSFFLFLFVGIFAQAPDAGNTKTGIITLISDSLTTKYNTFDLRDFIFRVRSSVEHNNTISYPLINNPSVPIQIPVSHSYQSGILKQLISETSKNNLQSYKVNINNAKQFDKACADTSYRRLLGVHNGTIFPRSVTPTSDGGILVTIEMYDSTRSNPFSIGFGLLLKLDANNNIIWLKQFAETNPGTKSGFSFTNAFELSNHDIICSGYFSNIINSSVYSTIVYRLTSSGDIIWKNNLKSNIGIFNSPSGTFTYSVANAIDGKNGDVILCGTSNSYLSSGHIETIIRLDNLGKLVWDANFGNHGVDGSYLFGAEGAGVFLKNGQLVLIGLSHGTNNPQTPPAVNFLTLDYNNGNLLRKRFFKPQYSDALQEFEKSFTYYYNHCTRLSNGKFLFYGKIFSDFINMTSIKDHFAVIEFDSSFNFIKSYTISSGLTSNYYGNLIYFNSAGKGLLSLFQSIGIYPAINEYYASFNTLQFQNQRKAHYENISLSEPNGFTYLNDNGYEYFHNYYDNISSKSYIEFRKMHNSDTSSQCLGVDTTFLTFLPLHIIEDSTYRYLDANDPNRFVEVSQNFSQTDTLSTSIINPCKQINYCDTIKIHGNPAICGNSTSILFTAYKNQQCGGSVQWTIDQSAIDSMLLLSDSSVRIWFKNNNWQGKLYAMLPAGGCNISPIDSVAVSVVRSQSRPNLGPDTVLCTGNHIVLHAGNSYTNYQWQDGSTDSVFNVVTAGIYWVHVSDLCGNNFTDSITIIPYNVSINIGPDRTKCNNDTLHLNAPSGFISYQWFNNYNISSTQTQNVVINPLVDTLYYLKAEKAPGCFAYDSIRIKVFTSPKIDLGQDKSFCSGDSLVLNAGNGFNKYQWSTGETSQQIVARNAGSYLITATTSDNCSSKDTLKIISVYANPTIALDHDSTLCFGTSRILNAGNFISYLWNTGSTSQTISINNLGTYYVNVTDNNNCKGNDSAKITTILPSPANFLPADTALCSYGSLQLTAKMVFASYLWNTNEITLAITVKQPGSYWLQVKDKNNCSGRDSIIVAQKQCLQGFFIPNSFTPNNDGRNDVFKPMLFGNLKSYEFSIFNKWGETIFKSNDIRKGWDGTYKGLAQQSNVFVWICKYQFDGEPIKIEKGTVVLLK